MNKRLSQTKTLNINVVLFCVLFIITLLSGLILISSKSRAAGTTTSNATVTVGAACSMTGALDTAHDATLDGGTYSGNTASYANGIGRTTLRAFCNDSNGFAIYAIGFTGDAYFGENHTKLMGTNTDEAIITGTATSGNTSNWSMKLEKITDASSSHHPEFLTIENSFDSYHAVPDTYTKVATYSATTDATLGARLTTTYAAYIAGAQVADTYTGKVKYTLVHPASETPAQPQLTPAGKICYYAKNNKSVGTMGCQDVSTSSSSATLLASNFSLESYGFAGWSDVHDYESNANAHFYGPQETISYTEGQYSSPNAGLSLYAVWVKSKGSLQNATTVAGVCSNLIAAPTDGTANLSNVSALTDERDGEVYAIAKLADGNCWMIENLRLENTGTDNANGSLAQGYGKYSGIGTNYGNFSGLADAESTNFSDSTTANTLYYSGTQSGTASVNIGTTSSPGYRMPRYNNWNNQTTSAGRPQDPTTNYTENNTTRAGMYSYGNYYTWHAAIANLAYNGSNNQSTIGTSLCPTGWRLPQGGNKNRIESNDDNDFWNLTVDALNDGVLPANYNNGTTPFYATGDEARLVANKLRSYPNNFLYSGRIGSSSVSNRGATGYYWSSTAGGTVNAYYLQTNNVNTHPGTLNTNKCFGYSVRCLVDT